MGYSTTSEFLVMRLMMQPAIKKEQPIQSNKNYSNQIGNSCIISVQINKLLSFFEQEQYLLLYVA